MFQQFQQVRCVHLINLVLIVKIALFDFAACEVNFDNTPVPAENILGGVGGGFRVSAHFVEALRQIDR